MATNQKVRPKSWIECKNYIVDNKLTSKGEKELIRRPELTEKYKKDKIEKLKLYIKYVDFIKHKFLGFDVEKIKINSNNSNDTNNMNGVYKLKAINKDSSYNYNNIALNDFGYYLDPLITHYVLWSTHSMSKYDIKNKMKIEYPFMDYLWWKNAINVQTIPEIWHVHILAKYNKNALLFHGFIRNDILNHTDCKIPHNLIIVMNAYLSDS